MKREQPEMTKQRSDELVALAKARKWGQDELQLAVKLYAQGMVDGFRQARECPDCNGVGFLETKDANGERALASCGCSAEDAEAEPEAN